MDECTMDDDGNGNVAMAGERVRVDQGVWHNGSQGDEHQGLMRLGRKEEGKRNIVRNNEFS